MSGDQLAPLPRRSLCGPVYVTALSHPISRSTRDLRKCTGASSPSSSVRTGVRRAKTKRHWMRFRERGKRKSHGGTARAHTWGMMLLRFAFQNHKSFRDEVDLTFARSSPTRPSGDEALAGAATVAAIYGPNASGKSGILSALQYATDLIAESSRSAKRRSTMRRTPFALDDSSRDLPSTFIFGFVDGGIEYEYGFSVSKMHVVEEWLYSFPKGRKRALFERDPEGSVEFGRFFGAGASIIDKGLESNELILSRGALLSHPLLERLEHVLTRHIAIANFSESDRSARLRGVVSDVLSERLSFEDLRLMLRVADVGIEDASVEKEETSPEILRTVKAVMAATAPEGDEGMTDEELERYLEKTAQHLVFTHAGAADHGYPLRSTEQSTGTLAWISLASPAIKALRTGGVLAIDELDASLHPQLAQVMVKMFKDETINSRRAQLLFTTHDTFFLSPVSELDLSPREIWFVEKGADGASEVFSLADFKTRSDQNISRRYLQGRYGAVPSVAPSFLASLVRPAEVETAGAV